ncbi:MAG: PAS domain S-box protein, partial [Candidatus Krumholzibacteriia bacterium]
MKKRIGDLERHACEDPQSGNAALQGVLELLREMVRELQEAETGSAAPPPATGLAAAAKRGTAPTPVEPGQPLRESEESFRALSEDALAGVYLFQDGRLRYVNRRFVEILGYTQQEILDLDDALSLVAPERRGEIETTV